MIIAVDAVGGDFYPESPVKGAIEASKEHRDLNIILLGPEETVKRELDKYEHDSQRIHIKHAPQIIEMDEQPAQAVKTKRDSSIVVGLGMLKAGKCEGFVSAGNTGALLAASTFLLGKLEGVLRPAIAATYPTVKGFRLLMDAGANLEVRPEMYYQFAQMGAIYVEHVMGIENPKIGLMNVGEEDEKGTDDLKEAFGLLSELPNFVGNLEGRDILPAKADVFVCDGLVGNLLLKLGESIPENMEQFISKGIKTLELSSEEAEKVVKVLKVSLAQFNYENVGGVPFLGVDGVSLVGHGGSSPKAMMNMVLNAVKCVENNVNDKIIASLK
ncbi:MAG TPA: phosphate acyltransferase PlsX [Halalkalibaculum sp.]|nr:phosphate acyltransferase PlsX [Halalkalibaculum sp.]